MTSVLALLAIGIATVSLAFLMGRWESNESMAGAVAACAVFVLVVFAVISAFETTHLFIPNPALAYATTFVYYFLLIGLSAQAHRAGGTK